MNKDYTYCLDENKCIHRRDCKRWIGNYLDDEVKKLYADNIFIDEVDFTKCIPNYKDNDCTNNFKFLDRFRFSDGSEFKESK